MLNSCIFMGNLTKDPETKRTPRGTVIANFTVAVNPSIKKEGKEALFLNCTAFGSVAENIAKFFRRGRSIIVSGRLENDLVDDPKHPGEKRQLYWLNVSTFDFPDNGKTTKQEQGGQAPAASASEPLGAISDDSSDVISDDDLLPF